jgi:hypothetical protein
MDRPKITQDKLPKKIEVTAYSGYKANERPLSFAVEGERMDVREIIDRWYGVESDYYKVLAGDGRVYILKWHRLLDVWLLVNVHDPRSRMKDA